jgi:hypothetical protein
MTFKIKFLRDFTAAESKGIEDVERLYKELFEKIKNHAPAVRELAGALWDKSEEHYQNGEFDMHDLYERLYYQTEEHLGTIPNKAIKYIWVSVLVCRQNFKEGCDCTAGGLTSQVDNADLYCDCTREEAIEHCRKRGKDPDKQLILVRRQLFGNNADYVEPLTKPEGKWNMFGGNYVVTSDSRYREFTGSNRPLPVFDRFEL